MSKRLPLDWRNMLLQGDHTGLFGSGGGGGGVPATMSRIDGGGGGGVRAGRRLAVCDARGDAPEWLPCPALEHHLAVHKMLSSQERDAFPCKKVHLFCEFFPMFVPSLSWQRIILSIYQMASQKMRFLTCSQDRRERSERG